MKTKSKTAKVGNLPGFREPVEETAKREVVETPVEQTNGNKPKERVTISFDVDEGGSPDFSSMRGKTKERVKQFFSDPKIASEFGTRTAIPEVQIFHPAMISGMYDMLGTLEAVAAQRWGNIPEPVAKQVFKYTPEEKEALAGPTIRVLNKYVSEWMIKYQDELALASLLIAVTVAKVNAAIVLTKMQAGGQVKREEPAPKTEDDTKLPTM